jgi:tRNA-splicing ligase RtcB
MDLSLLARKDAYAWEVAPSGKMRVPAIIYASKELVADMDPKVYEQVTNVATLPGIVKASYAMPDAHWGYGFPIGGVAAFDPEEGGVVSAGGVGFDISCGVRCLNTGLKREEVLEVKADLVEVLYHKVPAGLGSRGRLHLTDNEMDAMLTGGARWAVKRGYGTLEDLERIEEQGCMAGAKPEEVSYHAKSRQRDEVGTLGSGNHYLEVQYVAEIHDAPTAQAFGLQDGDVVVSIHCGSRGLGHQIGTDFLRKMAITAGNYGIALTDRELACAPLSSPVGKAYLGAMRAAINCALANRQVITHLTREAFAQVLPQARLLLLYDVSPRWPAPEVICSPQGSNAGIRPWASRLATSASADRPARFDRWQHGHGVLRAGRHGVG